MVFDRRLWHMRGPNPSDRVRKALFFAYTYRWIRPRDDMVLDPTTVERLTPAQRQLVGLDDATTFDRWMPDHADLPVRELMGNARP